MPKSSQVLMRGHNTCFLWRNTDIMPKSSQVLMRGHNTCFFLRNTDIMPKLSPLPLIWSTGFVWQAMKHPMIALIDMFRYKMTGDTGKFFCHYFQRETTFVTTCSLP